jgi:hypothetical protein
MSLRLNGSTSGYTEIDAPAVAGSNTLVLPTGNGSDGNILGTDGAGNLSWVGGRMVLETAKASTSGTSVDFTGIPSWVKKITVMFSGVSTNGTSNYLVQLGDAGGVENTGYVSSGNRASTATVLATSTAGIVINVAAAASTLHGTAIIASMGANLWAVSVMGGLGDGAVVLSGGSKTLSDTLDRVRITTVNGTDTFDAGSVNLLLEG